MTDLLEELENFRIVSRLSQRALAAELGISQSHYSKIVSRTVSISPELMEIVQRRVGKKRSRKPKFRSDMRQEVSSRIRTIESQLRQLRRLIENEGFADTRRSIRRVKTIP